MRIQDGWELMPVKAAKADDVKPERVAKKTSRKKPVTMTLAHDLVAKVDLAAKESGMSRAAYVSMALNYAVTHGIFK